MPIYEFKCSKCEEFFELLVMKKDDEQEIKCPKCGAYEFERVLSTTNYNMTSYRGAKTSVQKQNRTCSTGSCSTYTIPGVS